jgi:fructosamine-3-kinase
MRRPAARRGRDIRIPGIGMVEKKAAGAALAPRRLKARIEALAGIPLADLRPYASGNNTALYIADFKGGARMVAKVAAHVEARLALEAWMLRYLAAHTQLPVPEVLHSADDVLLIQYIPHGAALGGAAQEDAARHLARLHAIRGPAYGFERATQIGALEQPNSPLPDWRAFFRDRRLMPMAWLAHQEGRIDGATLAAIEKLAGRLDLYISDPGPPSLVHGDVWAGNVLAAGGRVAAFIDPAIYHADAEIELAFAMLFGSFDGRFFHAYSELNPIRPGFFEVRRHLYNLYPLLVHVRMFGAPYAEAVAETLKRFTI